MDGAEGVAWQKVTFVKSINVTPEHICANIHVNAGRPLPEVAFKAICICASGPSLGKYLDEIKARQAAGWHIATMNGSHNHLIANGVTPDYYFQIDARPGNLPFLDQANDHTTYVIGSQCQPEIFDALAGRKVMIWQVHNYDGAADAIRSKAPYATIFSGAYNVGQSCLNPILAMGYRRWALFGYDGSMLDGEKHAFAQPQNAGEEVHRVLFQGKEYWATGTMAHHAETFIERWRQFAGLGIDIELRSEGLLPDMVRSNLVQDDLRTCPPPPPPPPRRQPKSSEKLRVVTFKWKGHIPYSAQDVNIWGSQLDRWLAMPHELVCVTDDPSGIDGGIRTIPLWRDHFEHGQDWHRLKLFADEMADLIGPRIACTDLDTVFCGPLDPIFDHSAPFKAWADPFRPDQYCTSVFQMEAGAFPHVFEEFDVSKALALRYCGRFSGYDQAWISFVLSGQPIWTEADGMLSFKRHILNSDELASAAPSAKRLPPHARVINFHGKFNPRDAEVQQACPWVAEHYR